jgi:hypothetical protein
MESHIQDAFLLTSKVGLLLQMNGTHSDELEDDCGQSFNKCPGLCLNQPLAFGRGTMLLLVTLIFLADR